MLEEILPNLFRITVPLPQHPLQSINSYIITSKDRNLLIDTGWNRLECAETLLSGLDELGVTLARTDVLLTHIHADHSGLIGLFKNKQTRVFCGRGDLECIDHYLNTNNNHSWQPLRVLAKPHGFSLEEIEAAIDAYTGNKYAPTAGSNFIPIDHNDVIVVGNYKFHCIPTPGHTPGHTCLYDGSNKILFSGDHLLGRFSPTISQWNLSDHYIANYLASLQRLNSYTVNLVLPGHWDAFTNCHIRIRETQSYHQCRQSEIIALLAGGEAMTAYQIASSLSYNMKHDEWPFFSISRKWGAVADTIAQLCYLRNQGALTMILSQQHVNWKK